MLYFKSLKLFMKYSSGLISSWKQTEQLEWKTQVVPNMIKGYQYKLWSFSLHNFCNKTFLPRGQFLIVLNIIKWIWIMRAWVTRFFKSLWEVHVITYTYPRYPKALSKSDKTTKQLIVRPHNAADCHLSVRLGDRMLIRVYIDFHHVALVSRNLDNFLSH